MWVYSAYIYIRTETESGGSLGFNSSEPKARLVLNRKLPLWPNITPVGDNSQFVAERATGQWQYHIIYQSFFFQQDQIVRSAYSSSKCQQTLFLQQSHKYLELTSIYRYHSATIFIHQKAFSQYIPAVANSYIRTT